MKVNVKKSTIGIDTDMFVSLDDMQYPEYARLRAYIDDFKKSILAYP